MIIAIDGPAGSGKSTIAREVAKQLGLRYLDTGAMYRAVTLLALEAGLVPDRVAEAGILAQGAQVRLEGRSDDLSRVFVGEREVTDEIRGRLVSRNVSLVSAEPGVRAALTARQRAEVAKGDVVLEGRDMGTVVAPHADLKVYLTASVEERARRRQAQLGSQGVHQTLEELIADINVRDAYDSGRSLAPLRKAEDAVEIDTTDLTIAQVIERVRLLAAAAGTSAAEQAGEPAQRGPVDPLPGVPGKWRISRMTRSPLDTVLYRVAYCFVPHLFRWIFRMRISGAEHFPPGGSVVLASNHRSNFDPFFLGSASPRQIHFMAKTELWRFKPLGKLIERLGSFPIARGEADRQAVRRALDVLGEGAVLGIFPEGRRQRLGGLGDIHPGVSLFSLREGVVTVPVVMEGTERLMQGRMIRLPRVRVKFGPPIVPPATDVPRSQRAKMTSERLTEALRSLIAALEEEKK